MTTSDRAAAVGCIVLAGGASSRLGVDKATLDWHGTKLYERVARLLARGLGGGPIVVVDRFGSDLDVPSWLERTTDSQPDAGPLVGLLAGLEALAGRVDSAVVVPCDLPLLHPAVVRKLAQSLASGSFDLAAPMAQTKDRVLPLPGAWSLSSTNAVRSAVAAGQRSPAKLAKGFSCSPLTLATLAEDPEVSRTDPDLESLRDIDTPEDHAGLLSSPPKVRVSRSGRVSTLQAWTLGQLASAIGGDPDGPCVVNGLPIEFDPAFPLARRDAVSM